ncbi:hypothetical protein O181_086369 [Austropuccinia psidii MF-1]|uniref:CCHC-type domain-containing protein n=1 Tax=Austropuccinia psidii MF-1 TaxID=1389203 RepID=A0A9Q3INC1_9BASI|nr:hypothetical protein [Austropuccinia psidii MF-1]
MFKEDFNIPDEYTSARLHSLFTKSEKEWDYKMRRDHGKHSWPWWEEQVVSKWANDSWRFRMENSFEEAIFNIERDRLMSCFLKQKDRLTPLHPDISETMVHERILRKCGGDLEHSIRRRCIETCSIEDYTNSMEDITTRTKIGRNWYQPSIDRKNCGKPIPKPNKPHDIASFKCHKCVSTSHLANTCPKKATINEIGIEKDDTKETNDVPEHESDSEPSEEEELPDELDVENINVSFEVTEPARAKGYTAGSSFITNIVTPELTLERKEELIETKFQYNATFSSDNELLGAIKCHEVEIMLNVEISYPPLLRIQAYPASPSAREAL